MGRKYPPFIEYLLCNSDKLYIHTCKKKVHFIFTALWVVITALLWMKNQFKEIKQVKDKMEIQTHLPDFKAHAFSHSLHFQRALELMLE